VILTNQIKVDKPSALLVQLQNTKGAWVDVGVLYNLNEINWFEFSDQYWNLADRPILGQRFEDSARSWRPSARVALPNWFSHLLPEGRLRDAVAHAAHIHRAREFNLLARIGIDDLPGALRIRPTVGLNNVRTPPELLDAESGTEGDSPLIKFSLAGAQLKFSIYRKGKGLTIPVKGEAGNAIAKLPDGRLGYSGVPEAEFACLELAKHAGINVARCRLDSLSSITGLEEWAAKITDSTLIVDRFDRSTSGQRVHMEELAQILNVPAAREDLKYKRANFETVGTVIGALCGIDVVGDVIDRIVLNILVGNGDAHLKNWAILYGDGTTATLSPMYDVLPTVLYIQSDDMGMKLSGSRQFESVQLRSFDRLGERSGFGVGEARRRAAEATERIMAHWMVLRENLSSERYEQLTKRYGDLQITKMKILLPEARV
jgi:serine/threonine-protein kinase HipA